MVSRIVSGLEKSISGEPALMTGPRQASLWRRSQPTWPRRPKIKIFGIFIGQTLSTNGGSRKRSSSMPCGPGIALRREEKRLERAVRGPSRETDFRQGNDRQGG